MPVKYRLTRINDNITGKKDPRYSVTLIRNGNVDLDQLAHKASQMSTVSYGDTIAVVQNLIYLMAEEMKEGKTVSITGIGTFFPTAELIKEVEDPENVRSESIRLKSISFRPSPKLRKRMSNIKFVKSEK